MTRTEYRRRIHRAIAVCALLIAAGMATAFALRSRMVRAVADVRLQRMASAHKLAIGYRSLQVEGFSTLCLHGLTVSPLHTTDTLLALQQLKARLNFASLLRRNLVVEEVVIDSLNLSFRKRQGVSNYGFLFHRADAASSATASRQTARQPDYARRTRLLMRMLFGLLPAHATLSRIHVSHQTDSASLHLSLPRLTLREHRFNADFAVCEDTLQQQWHTEGVIASSSRRLTLSLSAPSLHLPNLHHRWGADVCFDTLTLGMECTEADDEEALLSGKIRLKKLAVNHRRLSPTTVRVDSTSARFHLHILPQAFEIDSSSYVCFNRWSFTPYLRAERDKAWHFTVGIERPWFPARQLFTSLPQGLFNTLQGIQTKGDLSYHFLLDVDLARPDSLRLESALNKRGFSITGYGATPLDKMNEEFIYTAYEEGEPVRSFAVGPSWEHFTPLNDIPLMLQTAVMQSEDGGFFHHNGFLPDALREALIYDLKKHRFARGGSTISMQLVKNVFLSRNKNLTRKLEEALIVWLIEQQRLTTKERMYEVYLNIAEWGPLVYGIREAADYYFAKQPAQLTPAECIFLASIIPRPKHWKWSFTPEGRLRDSQEEYFRLLASRLQAKGLLTEEQALQIGIHQVELKGRAAASFSSAPEP